MANNRSRNRGNPTQHQQHPRRQIDQTRSMVSSVAGQFAKALLQGSEDILAKMTLYSQESGGIGSDASNVTTLRQSGASGIKRIFADSKTKEAMVLFGNGQDISCIALLKIVDGGHVMGDWELYKKA